MVSPYIPFMQIRALQPYALNSQLSLKGSVVNIHTEINDMISVLPRKFDEMSVVQIKLKRHLDHQTHYMYETIKPSNIVEALKYLINTPLYKKHNITVNDEFFKGFERNSENDVNFIVDDFDKPNNNNCNNINTTANEIKNVTTDNNENGIEDDFEVNDEVLILDRNKEISSDVITIAPGQDKQPVPWHKVENIDELCFPKIFGGHILDKEKKLTYTERTYLKSEEVIEDLVNQLDYYSWQNKK